MNNYINMPAMDALNNEESIPAVTDLTPIFAMSGRLVGIKFPSPPTRIPKEEMFANPQSEKLTIATVFSDSSGIFGAKDA
jgi:hypothetical protein